MIQLNKLCTVKFALEDQENLPVNLFPN